MPFDATEHAALDIDPVEARVIDEALRILGPNGEKWITGSETDKQHNHCMIGAIRLARRRLKVKGDSTVRLIHNALHREGQPPSIPHFNDLHPISPTLVFLVSDDPGGTTLQARAARAVRCCLQHKGRRFDDVRKIFLRAKREALSSARRGGLT